MTVFVSPSNSRCPPSTRVKGVRRQGTGVKRTRIKKDFKEFGELRNFGVLVRKKKRNGRDFRHFSRNLLDPKQVK